MNSRYKLSQLPPKHLWQSADCAGSKSLARPASTLAWHRQDTTSGADSSRQDSSLQACAPIQVYICTKAVLSAHVPGLTGISVICCRVLVLRPGWWRGVGRKDFSTQRPSSTPRGSHPFSNMHVRLVSSKAFLVTRVARGHKVGF